jgi:transcriptional regulator with GAF, ATPase, and Fis domain
MRRHAIVTESRARSSSVRLPLRVGGGEVGALVVAYRTPREDYRGTDLDLLAALASQVAVVVRRLALADDLAAARMRIIDAARQERGLTFSDVTCSGNLPLPSVYHIGNGPDRHLRCQRVFAGAG